MRKVFKNWGPSSRQLIDRNLNLNIPGSNLGPSEYKTGTMCRVIEESFSKLRFFPFLALISAFRQMAQL